MSLQIQRFQLKITWEICGENFDLSKLELVTA